MSESMRRTVAIMASKETSCSFDTSTSSPVAEVKKTARNTLLTHLGLPASAAHADSPEGEAVAIHLFAKIPDDTPIAQAFPTQGDPIVALVPVIDNDNDEASSSMDHGELAYMFIPTPVSESKVSSKPPTGDQKGKEMKQRIEKEGPVGASLTAKLEAMEKRFETQDGKIQGLEKQNEEQGTEIVALKRQNEEQKKQNEEQKKQNGKLKDEIKGLRYTTQSLQNQNAAFELELKESQRREEQINEDLKASKDAVSHLKEKVEFVHDEVEDLFFLQKSDSSALEYIKQRNLLNRIQAQLALKFGLDDTSSVGFRLVLGSLSDSLETRRSVLKSYLGDHSSGLNSGERMLISTPAALDILAEPRSKIRTRGNTVSHGEFKASWYEPATRSDEGLKALLNCLPSEAS
ncbi:hypothetical protein DFP72DRAFT_134829 [Ephemerocybe angulata]|uniref:Uncharacterized protein n=1 Tax=Ephemerocybe angulata TaxID=980116 RepID=A0A8H6I5R1_9AGAR|nr:hypothetical protein DFP72DRAFT_134829 [Tulosesus angulatus]